MKTSITASAILISQRKLLIFLLLLIGNAAFGQQRETFDIVSYTPPKGWKKDLNEERVVYEYFENNKFCQIYIWKAAQSLGSNQSDFEQYWDFLYAKKYKINEKSLIEKRKENGWDVTSQSASIAYQGTPFTAMLVTFTKDAQSFNISSNFNDLSFAADIKSLITSLDIRKNTSAQTNPINLVASMPRNPDISTSTTYFDDGWSANALTDYVKLSKGEIELRLHYIDKALDDARPNTVDAPEYYWQKHVMPYFDVRNVQKWSGVEYPVIYHMQGNAIEKATGKQCYIAIKIVYSGGARPIVVITPNQNAYQQAFPHPNDIDPMLNANRFAVTAKDIVGSWSKSGGNGMEYYNAYSGTYAGVSALSTTDEFIFNANGTYQSIHNSANTGSSGTTFAALKYNGKFTVNNWELIANNRVGGKTKKFLCQFEAIKGGYLLILTDSDYEPLKYVLFKNK